MPNCYVVLERHSQTLHYERISDPITTKQRPIAAPPATRGILLPHLSIQSCVGIVHTVRTIPLTPDARKDAALGCESSLLEDYRGKVENDVNLYHNEC